MKAIVAYIRIDDPDAAIRMYENIKASIGKLADFPLMGPVPLDRKVAEQGYRMIVVDPYLVFYILVMENNTVEVHRVLHGKQDFPRILDKQRDRYIVSDNGNQNKEPVPLFLPENKKWPETHKPRPLFSLFSYAFRNWSTGFHPQVHHCSYENKE